MNKVPYLDFYNLNSEFEDILVQKFRSVIRSGKYVLGDELHAFEAEFADFIGSRYAVGVSNGLDALHLSLRVAGVGTGDEVIVPANTYIATWLAVTMTGAVPIPVDCEDGCVNIGPDPIRLAITERTKAIIVVHLYGEPAKLANVVELAQDFNLTLIEDVAQAHGAIVDGQRAGSVGTLGAFSFYPGKNLGAIGDGGIITTNSERMATELRALRNYGSQVKYRNEIIGFNNRLDEIQAAILRVKLQKLDDDNSRRSRIAEKYRKSISNPLLRLLPMNAYSVHHIFPVFTRHRDEFRNHLESHGVGSMIHYPIPPHLQTCYRHLGFKIGDFPVTEALHAEEVSLPIFPQMVEHDVQCVIDACNSFRLT